MRKKIKYVGDPPGFKPYDTINGRRQNLPKNVSINISGKSWHSNIYGPKVQIILYPELIKSHSFWVTISDCPTRLCKKKLRISDKELFDIYKWVAMNKETLLEYWEDGCEADFIFDDWEEKLIKL